MYQTFIGLEVHIHLYNENKSFCGCRSAFGDEPNTNICPVCVGYPGVMPTLNIGLPCGTRPELPHPPKNMVRL
jgi:aspartyl-tRNA(Asn)/glutamyl-tRNA(Gln) amidotransferase subunit B